jgi:hypothetical protein
MIPIIHVLIFWYILYITLKILPCIFDFCSFCHNPNRQTVSNALLKSTKEQYSFFPKEKYIAIRECKTKILSTVENYNEKTET